MIAFYSTTKFRNSAKKLHKEREYNSLVTDIANAFKDRPIAEIRNNRDLLKNEENLVFVKLRITNSYLNLSKQKGWRLIYCVSRKTNEVYFSYI